MLEIVRRLSSSVFLSSYQFWCVRHGPSQENNGSSECQLLVSPAPMSRSVIPNRWWILTNRWQPHQHPGITGTWSLSYFQHSGGGGTHKYHPGLIQTIISLCGLWWSLSLFPSPPTFLSGAPLSVSGSESEWQMPLCMCNVHMTHSVNRGHNLLLLWPLARLRGGRTQRGLAAPGLQHYIRWSAKQVGPRAAASFAKF